MIESGWTHTRRLSNDMHDFSGGKSKSSDCCVRWQVPATKTGSTRHLSNMPVAGTRSLHNNSIPATAVKVPATWAYPPPRVTKGVPHRPFSQELFFQLAPASPEWV